MKKIKTSLLAITMLTSAHTALAQSPVSLMEPELDNTHVAPSITSTEAEMKEAATLLGVGAGTALGSSFAKASALFFTKAAFVVAAPLAGYYTYNNWNSSLTYGQIGTNAWNAALADGTSLLSTANAHVPPYATSFLNAASSFVPAAIRNGDIFSVEGLGYLPEGIAAAGFTAAGGKAISAIGKAGLKLVEYAPKFASVASMAFGGLLKHIGYQPILDIVSITHKGLSNTMRKIANAVTDEFSNVIRQIANVKVEGSNSTAIDTVQ